MSPYTLPEGFKHLFQDRLYLESMTNNSYYTIVGKEGALGRRMFFGPLCVEYYTCDTEPVLTQWRGFRFVIWTRVTREDAPKNWIQFPKESTREVCAYLDINNTNMYYKTWRDTFKTYYYRFLKQTKYQVEEISCDEFCGLYKQYAKNSLLISMNQKQMRKLSSGEKRTTHFYILKNTENNDIVAGIAGVDCFSVEQSFYITAFTRKDIAPKESGLWLCHMWMKGSSGKGISYANFGNIWTPGHPVSWKGFSDFKMKFNPRLIVLKPECIRFTFSLGG